MPFHYEKRTLKKALDNSVVHPHSPIFKFASTDEIGKSYGTDWNYILQTPLMVDKNTQESIILRSCLEMPRLVSFSHSIFDFESNFPNASKQLDWLATSEGSVFWVNQKNNKGKWVYDWDYSYKQEQDFFKQAGMNIKPALEQLYHQLKSKGIQVTKMYDTRYQDDLVYLSLPDYKTNQDLSLDAYFKIIEKGQSANILPFVHTIEYLQNYLSILPHTIKCP